MNSGKELPWCRHDMELLSILLALYEGNPPITADSPHRRPVIPSFDVFLDVSFNKPLNNSWLADNSRRHDAHVTSLRSGDTVQWNLSITTTDWDTSLPSGAHLGGQGPPRWAPEGRNCLQESIGTFGIHLNTLLNKAQVIRFIIEVVVTDRFHCITIIWHTWYSIHWGL